MSIDELKQYSAKPDTERTVVEDLAYQRVVAAKNSLPDVKEITDRTEGKAPQSIKIKDERPDPIFAILQGFGLLDDGENIDDRKIEETP